MTISADESGAVGSPGQIPLQDSSEGRRFHGDDVTRGGASLLMDVGLWQRDGDQEALSNVSDHNHFVPDPSDLPTKRGSEALDSREYDQQEQIVKRLRRTRASGDHVWGDTPGPVPSNSSGRECQ